MALGFPDSDALLVAIKSGLVSKEVAAGSARVGWGANKLVVVEPDKAVPAAVLQKLRAAGVLDAAMPAGSRAVRCWAEALAPIAVGVGTVPALTLFVTERVADLLDVAAELVRLGCDRIDLAIAGDHGVLRVVDPPTYTVVRALDRDRGLRVFAPDPAGQEATWTELGYHHPLAEHLRPDRGMMLLVTRDGWRTIRDEGWMTLDAALELAVPERADKIAQGVLPERRKVELRLSAGRRDVTSMWVIRDDAVAKVDKLLEYLPEEVVGRLMFAVSDATPPVVILRARTGRQAAPDLSIAAEEYAPLGGMADVYAPTGAIVEPPLRRERLRSILAIEPREVMWLARVGGNKFRVERINDDAFMPLGEWADYVLHTSAPALTPWLRSTVYDFAPFVSTGLEWASERPRDQDVDLEAKRKRRDRGKPPAVVIEDEAPIAQPRPVTPKPAAKVTPSSTPTQQVAIDAELAGLEAEFIALDAPGDAPERIALLDRLGHTYARLDRKRDAGLCFARAVWESPPAEAQARLDTWIAADLKSLQPAKVLDRALALEIPSGDDVRTVAALTARVVPAVAKDPHRVTRWLDDHDGELDARTLWLSRLGLARLANGDPLLLAHARDRILARLAGGLPVERELPAFLRLAGRSGALGNASGEHLTTALEELAARIDKTKRKRTPLEAPPHLTGAYVNFLLAYGFARIGGAERARGLVADARKALEPTANDAVHAYLIAAYGARVDQAIAGIASETPLSDELGTQLTNLDRVARYKVDRLREASRILEPLDRPDAIGAWIKKEKDSRGPEFAALREITDPVKRAKAVDKLVDTAAANDTERERLIDGVFDVLLELPESGAVPILGRTWPLISRVAESRRAVLYAEALVVAGHFGRTELVPAIMDSLAAAIRLVQGADLERVLQHSLRALRRIGLRAEVAELLAEAEHALPSNRIEALRGRLALAAGLAFLGETARALPIYEQARAALTESMVLPVRLDLTRALALAYAQAPLQHALGGLADLANQLRDITDSYGTNSHYCLSVLNFVESLVLGITSDDLALGEAGRRFVEDDEHLIRRRLHRDLGGAS
ncbi:MAG TPA: hypothetical protein VFQ65_01115 [Kofleriaceae bacterium]|nr:hypothetical protein [Kofleriaceae bacterium]